MHRIFNEGWVELVFGPMFAGKTEYLIHRIDRLTYAKIPFLIFKHKLDNRNFDTDLNPETEIMSRTGAMVRHSVFQVDNSAEIQKIVGKNPETKAIIIDEIQFFDDGIINLVNHYAKNGLHIILAGLDKNYHGDPFPVVGKLACLCDEIHKLAAICTECYQLATFTQLLNDDHHELDPMKPLVGNEEFTARCRKHFIPKGK